MPFLPLTNEPRDLKLGPDNDLVFENGDLVLTTGLDAVAQSCRIALQMFAGEWFLDLDAGIPYWQEILGYKPNIAMRAARLSFNSALLNVKGVLEVSRLDISYNSQARSMTVTWQVKTADGETPADSLSFSTLVGGSTL